jgi:hypothetical protein
MDAGLALTHITGCGFSVNLFRSWMSYQIAYLASTHLLELESLFFSMLPPL